LELAGTPVRLTGRIFSIVFKLPNPKGKLKIAIRK